MSLRELSSASGCVAFALLPLLATLPVWVPLLAAAIGALRLGLAAAGRSAPPRALCLGIAALCFGLLFAQFHTFNGLAAGTALLTLTAGLKLLETRTARDLYVVLLIGYFLSLAALLHAESFWLLGFVVLVCWLTTATLLRLASSPPRPDWLASVHYTGRVLLQAIPLTLVLWLFFPRFAGPLWQIPEDRRGAVSGLGDTMSPGDITDLALSDEVAFRVRYAGPVPPPPERYFRGPVLHDFDGHSWRRDAAAHIGAVPPRPVGTAYRYAVTLEPDGRRWVYALERVTGWDLARAGLTADGMLESPQPVSEPLEVQLTSVTSAAQAPQWPADERPLRDAQLPARRNPRARALAQRLRAAYPDDLGYAQAVLALFHDQPFFYTLTPPPLADDSVDAFLFDTRRGFCGHYASAFAMLMRAAGIPARVVTGYYGGALNPFADYWIVRQSDAHAWDEIWIAGRGWLRMDPTAWIARERVDRRLAQRQDADAGLGAQNRGGDAWFGDLPLRMDALRELWRRRIMGFDQASQQHLLRSLHVAAPGGQTLALVLAAGLCLALGWLTWQVRRDLAPPVRDGLARAFAILCRRLAAIGLPRRPSEGAEAYAERVGRMRPDLVPAVSLLCRRYSALRYGAVPARHEIVRFAAAVRAFRPRPR
jgi:transglutaminase-like putative cysteine protease